jgi:hypothetical protein
MYATRNDYAKHTQRHARAVLWYDLCMSNTENKTKRKPRQYHKITSVTLAKYKALEALHGNGAAAVREQTPEILNPKERAFRIRTKTNLENADDFINDTLQLIGIDAIQRLGMLVNSTDEKVATKNVHFTIDHVRGKALQRSESKHLNLNIETVLE